jgi:neuralized-like protein 4
LFKAGDRVGVRRRADGTLNFYVNGIDQGQAATNVSENVFGVVDLYGQYFSYIVVLDYQLATKFLTGLNKYMQFAHSEKKL